MQKSFFIMGLLAALLSFSSAIVFAPSHPEVVGCANEGAFCGGIAGISCCKGFDCSIKENFPDAGGTCVPQNNNCEIFSYSTCPSSCVRTCVPSSCTPDGRICTKDCSGPGSCKEKVSGVVCPLEYKPVCGNDGTPYPNSCEASLAGVAVACPGQCPCSGACNLKDSDCPSLCSICTPGYTGGGCSGGLNRNTCSCIPPPPCTISICPDFPIPFCEGELIDQGMDSQGCPLPPKCVSSCRPKVSELFSQVGGFDKYLITGPIGDAVFLRADGGSQEKIIEGNPAYNFMADYSASIRAVVLVFDYEKGVREEVEKFASRLAPSLKEVDGHLYYYKEDFSGESPESVRAIWSQDNYIVYIEADVKRPSPMQEDSFFDVVKGYMGRYPSDLKQEDVPPEGCIDRDYCRATDVRFDRSACTFENIGGEEYCRISASRGGKGFGCASPCLRYVEDNGNPYARAFRNIYNGKHLTWYLESDALSVKESFIKDQIGIHFNLADEIYEKLNQVFGLDVNERMFIEITSKEENRGVFWTPTDFGGGMGLHYDSFWDTKIHRLITHELVNAFVGKAVPGGWPTDWWVNHRSPFPNAVKPYVYKEMGRIEDFQRLQKMADDAGWKDYSQYLFFKELLDEQGLDLYKRMFAAMREDGIDNLDNIGPNPSVILSHYVAAYLSIAAGRNLADEMNAKNLGQYVPPNTIPKYRFDPSVIDAVINTRNNIHQLRNAVSGAGNPAAESLLAEAENYFRKGNYRKAMDNAQEGHSCIAGKCISGIGPKPEGPDAYVEDIKYPSTIVAGQLFQVDFIFGNKGSKILSQTHYCDKNCYGPYPVIIVSEGLMNGKCHYNDCLNNPRKFVTPFVGPTPPGGTEIVSHEFLFEGPGIYNISASVGWTFGPAGAFIDDVNFDNNEQTVSFKVQPSEPVVPRLSSNYVTLFDTAFQNGNLMAVWRLTELGREIVENLNIGKDVDIFVGVAEGEEMKDWIAGYHQGLIVARIPPFLLSRKGTYPVTLRLEGFDPQSRTKVDFTLLSGRIDLIEEFGKEPLIFSDGVFTKIDPEVAQLQVGYLSSLEDLGFRRYLACGAKNNERGMSFSKLSFKDSSTLLTHFTIFLKGGTHYDCAAVLSKREKQQVDALDPSDIMIWNGEITTPPCSDSSCFCRSAYGRGFWCETYEQGSKICGARLRTEPSVLGCGSRGEEKFCVTCTS